VLLNIEGPFGWPSFESGLAALPPIPGLYVIAFPYLDGFIPYAVGITRRPVRKRFLEHTKKYLTGDYNILDVEAAQCGERKVLWKGWGWSPEKKADFEARKAEICELARRQMNAMRVFLIEVSLDGRLLERLEGALIAHYERAMEGVLFDRGMLKMPRWQSEGPVSVTLSCGVSLLGMPSTLEI
jgi:hypothetical protein